MNLECFVTTLRCIGILIDHPSRLNQPMSSIYRTLSCTHPRFLSLGLNSVAVDTWFGYNCMARRPAACVSTVSPICWFLICLAKSLIASITATTLQLILEIWLQPKKLVYPRVPPWIQELPLSNPRIPQVKDPNWIPEYQVWNWIPTERPELVQGVDVRALCTPQKSFHLHPPHVRLPPSICAVKVYADVCFDHSHWTLTLWGLQFVPLSSQIVPSSVLERPPVVLLKLVLHDYPRFPRVQSGYPFLLWLAPWKETGLWYQPMQR